MIEYNVYKGEVIGKPGNTTATNDVIELYVKYT